MGIEINVMVNCDDFNSVFRVFPDEFVVFH
jgi:hypothetical protein